MRERNYPYHEYGRNGFSDFKSHVKGRDFRESLVSVFIGNLNPVVDSLGLWGMFKPFGKVRDVFFSSKKRFQRRCFAFIRFDTLKEARRVAQRVHGMQFYGWPIEAKVASIGWNNRRYMVGTQEVRGKAFFGENKGRGREGDSDDSVFDNKYYPHRRASYAEAVKVFNSNLSKSIPSQEKCSRIMTWPRSNETEDWLSRSAVGELKSFSNVDSVNQKLEDRGFIFSSSFLGGKRIVWTFDSELDRDSFLNNRFFWKDSFVNMSKWRDSMLSTSRLRWVDAYGVPLQCWCKPFFMKLGGQVGEAVWIEESTVAKGVLDKGRVLISAPLEAKVSCTIDVKIGKSSFPVILVEDPMPVSSSWVIEFLGLKSASSNLNRLSTKEGVDHLRPTDKREWISEEENGFECDSSEEMSNSVREKKETRKITAGRSKEKGVRNALIMNPKSDWKGVGGAKGGREGDVSSSSVEPKVQVGSGSSESGSESIHDYRLLGCLHRASSAGGFPEDGEIVGYRQEMREEGNAEKCDSVGVSVDGRGVSLGSTESVLPNSRSVKIFGSKDGSCGGVSVSGNQAVYFNFVNNKDSKGGNYKGPGIDLFVDLGDLEPFVRKGNVEESVVSSCPPAARRKIKKKFPTRSHCMKTRSGTRGLV